VVPAGDRRDQKTTWRGYTDAQSRSIEFAGVTLGFLLIGLFIDSKTGTRPAFTVGLALFAIITVSISTYFRYKADIAHEEEGKPWKQRPR
jgi:F0F1-type ATP synthase assembly protein I